MKVFTSLVANKRRFFNVVFKIHLGLFFLLLTCSSFANSFHVAVDGSPNGDGSEFSPWDLKTALSHPSSVLQGDTIWLHAGVYKGHFTSNLNGAAGEYIIVRQFPGEKAILDGVGRTGSAILSVKGTYTIYWGFTVTDSNTDRISQIPGSFASDIPNATGVNVLGSYNKVINVTVHDAAGNGIGAWASGIDTEIYGCISYYNGWQGPDRGHGHAFYSQNESGTKVIENNIFFHNFNKGVQVYTSSSSIQGYRFEGNSIFNNGIISRGKNLSDNLLIGGGQPADRLVIADNYTFMTPSVIKTNVRLGYDVTNSNVVVRDNYLMGGFPVLRMNNWKSVEFNGNTIVGNGKLIYLEVPSGTQSSSYNWDDNTYHAGGITKAFNESAITFDAWKQNYSIDRNSQYTHDPPSGTRIFKRPNKYEPGRSSITIFNRDLNNSVSVDLSDLIEDGANYEIFDVQNMNQGPLLAGVYKGGSIDIPMDLTSTTPPIGNVPVYPTHTGIEFGVYLIISSPYSENDIYFTRNKETDTEK